MRKILIFWFPVLLLLLIGLSLSGVLANRQTATKPLSFDVEYNKLVDYEVMQRYTPLIPVEDAELMAQCCLYAAIWTRDFPDVGNKGTGIVAAVMYLKLSGAIGERKERDDAR